MASCRLDDRVGEAAARVRSAGGRSYLVTTAEGVLLGRLDAQALAGDPATTAEAAMTPGPLTIRPDRVLDSVRERFGERGIAEVVVTTSDGVLVGVLEIEAAAAREEPEEDASCDCEG